MAAQLATWVGTIGEGVEVGTVLGAEVPFLERWSAIGWIGAQRHPDGSIDPRDASVGVYWLVVSRPELVFRIQPGLNVPTGGIGSQLYFTPLSTASVDPYLTTDLVYGGTWLASLSTVTRVSVYDGWDRLRQGPFLRADLRGARRLGVFVPWIGVSAVRQLPSDPVGAVTDFSELAVTAGSVVNLADRWSVTGQLRFPLWRSQAAERQVAGGLSVRWVVGKKGGAPHE